MGSLKGIGLSKTSEGIGSKVSNTDSIMGLVLGGIATASLSLNTPVKLNQVSDAEALGINSSYDANNDILVHFHISEFFREAPDGTLYIMLVAQGTSLTDMVDYSKEHLKMLILSNTANREIKYAGVVLNPAAGYVSVVTGSLDDDVLSAIPKAQELVDSLAERNIYLDGIVIEGREFTGSATDADDLSVLDSENVNVIIAQEPTTAALNAAYAKSASVGTVLGAFAVRKISENIGSVDIINKPDSKKGEKNYSLSDIANNLWTKANLSGGQDINTLTDVDIKTLKEKRYILAGSYEGYDGIYFNGSMTCTEAVSGFSRSENNRVWNKAARLTIAALTPKINGKVKIDKTTGFIDPITLATWEADTNASLSKLLSDDDVSDVSIIIEPSQNVLGGEPINVILNVTPDGIAEELTGTIALVNPFK